MHPFSQPPACDMFRTPPYRQDLHTPPTPRGRLPDLGVERSTWESNICPRLCPEAKGGAGRPQLGSGPSKGPPARGRRLG